MTADRTGGGPDTHVSGEECPQPPDAKFWTVHVHALDEVIAFDTEDQAECYAAAIVDMTKPGGSLHPSSLLDPVISAHVIAPADPVVSPRRRYDQCDETCTVDCGHCKGAGSPVQGEAIPNVGSWNDEPRCARRRCSHPQSWHEGGVCDEDTCPCPGFMDPAAQGESRPVAGVQGEAVEVEAVQQLINGALSGGTSDATKAWAWRAQSEVNMIAQAADASVRLAAAWTAFWQAIDALEAFRSTTKRSEDHHG